MTLLRIASPGPLAVVGDIHGCASALRQLLALLPAMPIVVLGDVCDRGPDTRGVIDQLIARAAVGVRGNHEDWLVAWGRGEGFDAFALRPLMGGRATLDSYGVAGTTPREIEAERWRLPAEHRRWLESLADAAELEVAGRRWWLAHAGIPPHPPPALAPDEIVPWYAEHQPQALRHAVTSLDAPPELGRPLIVGHQPLAEARLGERLVDLDTGAGVLARGRLTALVLPELRLVTALSGGE